MSILRAREPERVLPEEPLGGGALLTVRAGECVVVRVGALDRQSGVAEIVAECRSREDHDMCSSGRWSSAGGGAQPGEHYYPVVVPIPAHSPTGVWELHAITLCDGDGNRRCYRSGKDFEEMTFQVHGRHGVDCTPPRLLGVRLGRS
jgi:hypothetical protein